MFYGRLKIVEGTVANVPPQGGRKHPHQEFIQIDTNNVLFILGGAFDGLEKIIEHRVGKKGMGFNADVQTKQEKNQENMLKHLVQVAKVLELQLQHQSFQRIFRVDLF